MTPETLRYQTVDELLLGLKAPLSGSVINGRAYDVAGRRLTVPGTFWADLMKSYLGMPLYPLSKVLPCPRCWETPENCKCAEEEDET